MTESRRTPGVVVGYGSIGRYHAEILEDRCSPIAIVDNDAAARARAAAAHGSALVVDSLGALDDAGWSWGETLGIIATWGPSHASLFDDLVGRGVPSVLCEKPLATSIADARRMAAVASDVGVRLAVHFHLRFTGFVEGLATLAEEHDLGLPLDVLVEGGARCLVTNGLHYIDLVCALYGERPSSVTSDASADRINPRGGDLDYYEGTAVWRFPSGRRLTISFSNASSVEESVRVLYRDAVLHADAALDVRLARRPADDVARFPAVTRTGRAGQVLYEGPVPGAVPYPGPTMALLDALATGHHEVVDGESAAAAIEACIAALAAGRDGRAVALPVSAEDPLGAERWAIS